MDTIYRQSMLLDFYQGLLTDKQRQVLKLHLSEDWSLSEIADEMKISRQGVSDTIHRGLAVLQEAEDKLGMVERFLTISKWIGKLEEDLDRQAPAEVLKQEVEELKKAAGFGSDQAAEDTGELNGI